MLEMEVIKPEVLEMEITGQIPSTIGGTTNYNELSGKPKINGVELKGDKTLEELGLDFSGVLQESKDYADSVKPTKISELTNDSDFAVTTQNNNFSFSQTINGTLTVNGDIVQNGESYETHAEQLYTEKDEIITRDGAVGGLSENQLTGIRAKKYDGVNDGQLGFDADGTARVGDVNDTQPLLTRDEAENLVEGQVLVWDETKLRAVGSSEYVKNTDYATYSKAGLVRPTNGLTLVGTNKDAIGIAKATDSQIDAKTDNYAPIVPANLDYAVKSVGDDYYVKQVEYSQTSTLPSGSDGGYYGRAYVRDKTNVENSIPISSQNRNYTLPIRDHNGNFYVANPTIAYHCANKQYVDGLVGDIESLLSEV